MKHITFLIFWALNALLFAQTNFDYTLTVFNNQGKPEVSRDVVFIETKTYERLALKTDANGTLSHTFTHGEEWAVTVGEMRNCIILKTKGGGKSSRKMTYDLAYYKRENEVRPDRTTIAFKTVEQKLPGTTTNGTNDAVIIIVLQDQKNVKYPNIDVALTCYATKTQYKTKSNAAGQAVFQVPLNNNYDIDIDGVECMSFVDVTRASTMTQNMLFQKKSFTETVKDGYIVQTIPANAEPSSSHARVKLQVNGGKSGGIKEDIYLRMLKSNKVYKAKTGDDGSVTFMLPVRGKYMVDFVYQKDADVIDLSQVKGIGFQNRNVTYVPDPRLENIENFIPKVSNLVLYDVDDFINTQYPEPASGDVDFYLKWGNKFNAGSKEALLEIGLKTKSKLTRKTALPLNLCFVIDKSGSMAGYDRIDQLKKALIDFIGQLNSTDIVSLVVFDDQSVVAVPAQPLGDKRKITDIIYTIQAGGGTVIFDGMVKGFEEVQKNVSPKYVSRLILLTDGYDSYPPEQVVSKAKEYIQKGIQLSAVGVGTDYNQPLMSQLASAGGGLLHFAGESNNIEKAFRQEMESILYPMAKAASLELIYNNQLVYRQLYGYENEKVTQGNMKVQIDHLFPGLSKLGLVKFDLINATKEIEQKPVVVRLKYTDVITGKPVLIEKSIALEWTEATGEMDLTIDKEHKKMLAVAIVNQSMKNMANAYEAGNREAAENAVKSAQEQLSKLFPGAKPHELDALTSQLKAYVKAFEDMRAMRVH